MVSSSCPSCLQIKWIEKKETLHCLFCGTEIVPHRRAFEYSENYQLDRGHYDESTRASKVETFLKFLEDGNITPSPQDFILEVGFGGGAVLEHLSQNHKNTYGIEAHEAAILRLRQNGIPREHLSTDLLQFSFKNKKFDFLFYLDSFEHILNSDEHLEQLKNFVHKGSRALLVLPRADSLSRWWMGSLWPHDLPDHWVFYSKKGLTLLWERHGWKLITAWNPRKKVSIDMVLRHFGFVKTAKALHPFTSRIPLWVQLGEMGVVFEKT